MSVQPTTDRDSIETEGYAGPILDSLSTGRWAKVRRKTRSDMSMISCISRLQMEK